MRQLAEVIDQMLGVVPDGAAELRDELIWLRTDVSFKAPEQMRGCWSRCSTILEACIGQPKTDWEKKVQAIFNDTEE